MSRGEFQERDIAALFFFVLLCIAVLTAVSVFANRELEKMNLENLSLKSRVEALESPPCEWSRALETIPHKSKETK